jgi:fucose-1-phosphate guanylyltransferase
MFRKHHNLLSLTHLWKCVWQVFEAMRGCGIHLLLLNASKFIHIGTTRELIHHLCADRQFQAQMKLGKDVFNCWILANKAGTKDRTAVVEKEENSPVLQSQGGGEPARAKAQGCVMHSVLVESSHVADNSVLEYCHFDVPVTVQEDSIVSNCQWLGSESKLSPAVPSLALPRGIFLHTVSVLNQGASCFVTVFFSITDDLKASAQLSKASSLSFLGSSVGTALKHWNLSETAVTPQDEIADVEAKVSLWTLKLYPGAGTMTESLDLALDMVHSLQGQRSLSQSVGSKPLFSLSDALKYKDVGTMLAFRRQLFDQIQANRKDKAL